VVVVVESAAALITVASAKATSEVVAMLEVPDPSAVTSSVVVPAKVALA
jgi:hypothetical protein